MEQNFQTSFIPKRPMIEERVTTARPVGFLLLASVLFFFAVLIASAGLYFYKGVVEKSISKMENDLLLAKNRFEPSRISQLQVLDKRLKASTEILSDHVAISPIFTALQGVTMKSVRFTKFSYVFNDGTTDAKIRVKMSGVAVGYRSIALQSDLFAKEEYFLDPVFSNLSLDNSGNVLFDLDFAVDPTFVNYKAILLKPDTAGQPVIDNTVPPVVETQ
jgi:hypothetical protein